MADILHLNAKHTRLSFIFWIGVRNKIEEYTVSMPSLRFFGMKEKQKVKSSKLLQSQQGRGTKDIPS